MDQKLDANSNAIIHQLVDAGICENAEQAIRMGLDLLLKEQEKRDWLKNAIESAIAEGGEHTNEEVDAYLETEPY
jgi:Arc/MetJ-type ribon-helix-helix transcriptional regulator